MTLIQEARLNRSYLQRWVSVPFPPRVDVCRSLVFILLLDYINHGTVPDNEYLWQKRFKLNVLTLEMTNSEEVELFFVMPIARFMEELQYPLAEETGIAGKWSPWKNYTHGANLQPATSRAATIIALPRGKPQVTWVLMRICNIGIKLCTRRCFYYQALQDNIKYSCFMKCKLLGRAAVSCEPHFTGCENQLLPPPL